MQFPNSTTQNPLQKQDVNLENEYMRRQKWQENASHCFFDIEPYLRSFSSTLPEFAGVFITRKLDLDPNLHIPALPMKYAKEYNEERVMYLLGVPRSMTRQRLQELVSVLGTVVKLPTLIDLNSRETFRWIVMKDKEEATRVFKLLPVLPLPEDLAGRIVAITPCAPGRGLILKYHVDNKTFLPRPNDDQKLMHADKIDSKDIPDSLSETSSDRSGPVSKHRSYSGLNAEALAFADPSIPPANMQPNPLRALPAGNPASADAINPSIVLGPAIQFQHNTQSRFYPQQQASNPFQPKSLEQAEQTPIVNPLSEKSQNDSLVEMLRRAGSRNRDRAAGHAEDGTASPILPSTRRPTLSKVTAVPRVFSAPTRTVTPFPTVSTTIIEAKSSNKTIDGRDSSSKTEAEESTVLAPLTTPPATSWASIADAGTTKVIDIASTVTNNPLNRLRGISRVPSGGKAIPTEPAHEQLRVVFILGVPPTMKFQELSDAIKEGPLRSMHFGADVETGERYAAAVFQYAADAAEFMRVLDEERKRSRPGRFKWVPTNVRSHEFPLDETLWKMGPPTYATRRLTLVKGGLFFQWRENQLQTMIAKAVGDDLNLLKTFYYNGGNATVVFSNVEHAITAKAKLDEYSGTAGLPGGAPMAFAGLQVTFSKCPCVAPLVLVSSFPGRK